VTSLAELVVATDPAAWRAAGFAVDEHGVAQVGTVRLRFDRAAGPHGLRSWGLSGAPDEGVATVDGVPTNHVEPAGPPAEASAHEIGAVVIDHVVVVTPDIERTVAAVERELGLRLRRTRETESYGAPRRQAFFRMGEAILEVVGSPERDARGGPARFYGLAMTVTDLDAAVLLLGDRVGQPKPAVQQGRMIATVRKEAGLGLPLALMSPEP
jgi:catechol 2,3-dioxygenase-like lactoylglutathione lyase family enzyme